MLYNVVFISAIQQCESAIYMYTGICVQVYIQVYTYPLPPIPPSHPSSVITEHQAGLLVLYSSFLLVIYFIHDSVCVCVYINATFSVSPSLSPHPAASTIPQLLRVSHVRAGARTPFSLGLNDMHYTTSNGHGDCFYFFSVMKNAA